MSENRRIRVDVPSMVFMEQLGTEFELPTNPKLEEAILTINEACSQEVRRRERHELEEFMGYAYNEMKNIVNEGTYEEKRAAILKIINYKRKNPITI